VQREIRQESKRCTHKKRRGERRGETTKLFYLAGPLWGTKILASGTGSNRGSEGEEATSHNIYECWQG